MAKGGARPGAGRKKGKPDIIKRAAYEKAAEMGVEPILYSIEAVDCVMQQARAEPDIEKKIALYKLMHDMNADLLAYFHRKMPVAVETKNTTDESVEETVKKREAEVALIKTLYNAKK